MVDITAYSEACVRLIFPCKARRETLLPEWPRERHFPAAPFNRDKLMLLTTRTIEQGGSHFYFQPDSHPCRRSTLTLNTTYRRGKTYSSGGSIGFFRRYARRAGLSDRCADRAILSPCATRGLAHNGDCCTRFGQRLADLLSVLPPRAPGARPVSSSVRRSSTCIFRVSL